MSRLRRRLGTWERELPRVTHLVSKMIVEIALFLVFVYGVWSLIGGLLAAHPK
jgi:hypothetical protein